MKRIIFALLTILILASCEKEVTIDLDSEAGKLVVDGQIENNMPPIVRLSTSIGMFDKVDITTILNSFVHDAEVYVSNDTRTIRLKEYAIHYGGYDGYVYSIDTTDPTAITFLGEVNKSYTLKISYDGKTYESTTTIPPLNTGIDSMWNELPNNSSVREEDATYRIVKFRYNDDPTPGQKVRQFTSVNNSLFLPPFYSVLNDDIVNGTTVILNQENGYDKFSDSINGNDLWYFHVGDTVTLKWSAIDDATYNFFNTLEFSYGAVGNPFASPVIVSTNINNGALGIWAGYASTFHTIIVTE